MNDGGQPLIQQQPRDQGPLIILVAGEPSGDQLGAGLIQALRQQHPHLRFAGIGGDAMAAAGMTCWHHLDELSVMGLVEVLRHVPRLLALRRRLRQRIKASQAVMFIGIDSPDFNLPLARRLKQSGMTTAHYVSPSVWAWRPERVHTVAAACDLLLCLFPFEPAYYQSTALNCVIVGHPRADEIPLEDQTARQRQLLNIPATAPVLALLPGSRGGERQRLAGDFFAAAARLREDIPDLQVVTAQANQKGRKQLLAIQREQQPDLPLRVLDSADQALAACDAVLAASGTITLEALLYHRPMVVAYRLQEFSYQLIRLLKLMKTPWVSLPNILARKILVPELLQHEATPDKMATALLSYFRDTHTQQQLRGEFMAIHQQLRRHAHQQAAAAVIQCLQAKAQ